MDGDSGLLLKILLELLDANTLAADEDAWSRSVDDHVDRTARALDLDAGDTRTLELLGDVLTDVSILQQHLTKVLVAGEPARLPRLNNSQAKARGMDFLTHIRILLRPLRGLFGWLR